MENTIKSYGIKRIGKSNFSNTFNTREEAETYIAKENQWAIEHGYEPKNDSEIVEIDLKFANAQGYSDVYPNEIVKVNTERKLTIRPMESKLAKAPTFHVGGFAGHAENYEQKWEITSDENAVEIVIRKNKKGQWKDKHGQRYTLSAEPVKFYDYNF